MKLRPICILTFALMSFFSPLLVTSYGQEAKAPASVSASEKVAIATYTAKMKEGEKLAKEAKPEPGNPAAAFELIDKMVKIADSVKTEGLPADLKTAFEGFRGAIKKVIAHLETMPVPKELLTDQAKLQAWAAEQALANPKFLEEFQGKMGKFQEDMKTITAEGDKQKDALKAAHEKYGVDVDLDAGKKKPAAAVAPKDAEEEAPKPKAKSE